MIMLPVTRTTVMRRALLALTLAGSMSSIASANGGDLYPPAYERYPQAAPAERYYEPAAPVYRRVERAEPCRVFHERRVDAYGRETMHRIRMCDEGPVYNGPNGAAYPPEHGYGYRPRPHYEQSGYDGYPRPPAGIGRGYY